MVQRIVSSNLAPVVHFCTLNLEKSVRTILENLGWVCTQHNKISSSPLPRHNQLIEEDGDTLQPDGAPITKPSGAGLSISPTEASHLAQWGLTNHALRPAPKKGLGNAGGGANNSQGPIGEHSWDEYPNGRFTDVRSPAYGEIDGWGSGLKTNVRKRPSFERSPC